jgi:DEAD/DEAH box helicase domain-containing protein
MAPLAESTSIEDVLDQIRGQPSLGRNVAHWAEIPPQAARWAPIPECIHPELAGVLRARGIEQLYSHQAQALETTLAGKNVVIVTPTASGKTLCYNLPVLQRLLDDPESRALYFFPTKALAHDQYRGLYDWTHALGREIKVFTFDGDTPAPARSAIRAAGQIVLTNPDMLHTGILPNHTKWIKLFETLRTVVIDEMHQYRGVFGSHVANVIRRLKRICNFYGAKPDFICCSATIANPRELAERLVEDDFTLIDQSGAPRGRRVMIFYNPPVVNRELGIRASPVKQARKIAARFIERDIQTIVFGRSRVRVELLANYLKKTMRRLGRDPERIKAYRGGYLPHERREIEEGIKSGRVLGVVSTNALELGIDIGSLDVAILTGYPGTIASTWQQGGRAGRHQQTAVVVLVATSAPVDQFLMNHPDYFFGASPEHGIVNPHNIAILAGHLKCAIHELPLNDGEVFGPNYPSALLDLFETDRIVRRTGGRAYWSAEVYPAEGISLRTATAENFIVHNSSDENRVLAEVDYDSAQELIHEEAVYIHQGQTFHVDKLDWDRRRAYVRQIQADYYTDAIRKTDLTVLREDLKDEIGSDASARFQPLMGRSFGEVRVSTTIPKYKKVKFETHESVGYGDVTLPQYDLQTEVAWWSLRPESEPWLKERELDLGHGLQGLARLMHNVVSLYVMSDPRDMGSVAMLRAPFDERPTLYLFDKAPGGIGLARRAYGLDRRIFRAMSEVASHCACREGCPSCVGPPVEMGKRARQAARALLEAMVNAWSDGWETIKQT